MKLFPILTILALLCFGVSTAQKSKSEPIAHKTDVNKDIDPLKVYEQYVKDGYGTAAIYKKLANGHYFKNNYIVAKKYFEMLFKEETPDETLKFRYVQTLRALKVKSKSYTEASVEVGAN